MMDGRKYPKKVMSLSQRMRNLKKMLKTQRNPKRVKKTKMGKENRKSYQVRAIPFENMGRCTAFFSDEAPHILKY